MELNKNSVAIRLSAEQAYMWRALNDPRYYRRIKETIVTQPTEAEWADYRKAKAAHGFLLASPYFEDGGPDERSQVVEPEPRREYIYAETHDEWIARCLELDSKQ